MLHVVLVGQLAAAEPRIVEVRKIWDQAPHNAFTDLIRFQDQWYCVFREGQGHVSPDGALRIIRSTDGRQWESAAVMRSETADLRDAKITLTPGGQLMLSGAAALHDKSQAKHQSLVWFSADGTNWSDPVKVGDPDFWLWRVTWHGQQAYGIGYATAGKQQIRLYRSQDGRRFETWVPTLFDVGYPNETSMLFLEDDTCLCLLRRDGTPNTAQLGRSSPPYKEWSWQDLGVRVGGPHMLRLPDGRFVVAGRSYDGGAQTRLWWLDPQTARLTEILTLPSGGDTSYPGLVWHEGQLWVSYYASHEGKTSIYLARVAL
ncbi:MAG: exo-alpha-sialidase [Pirellulaceae bacterium]|nr:exo-alpha-sialidase [Pirellulaceae bacterium]